MRSLAVIPPMLLDDNQKKLRFYNNNGLLDDPKAINEETLSKTNYWTDTEKEIFREKYLHRPKNFGYIASALHNKVGAICLSSLLSDVVNYVLLNFAVNTDNRVFCNTHSSNNTSNTSLSQLRLRPWAFSMHQLATSWLILEGGSLSILARLERPAIYFKGFLLLVQRFNAVLLHDSLPADDSTD